MPYSYDDIIGFKLLSVNGNPWKSVQTLLIYRSRKGRELSLWLMLTMSQL